MIEIQGARGSAKVFSDKIEASSEGLIKAFCDQPSCAGSQIRIMPDVHAGKGCAIGTTMTIRDRQSRPQYRRCRHRLRHAHREAQE